MAFNRGFSPGYLYTKDVMQRAYPEPRGRYLGKAIVSGREVSLTADALGEGDGITFYKNDLKIGGFEVKDMVMKDGTIIVRSPFTLEAGEYDIYKTKDRTFRRSNG